jgi:transcriptional regulator with XRE-family HTH domain
MSDRGERLSFALRLRRVPKMTSLAADLGVDESAISRWRKGGAMSLQSARRLSEVLDISLDWLVLGRGEVEGHKAFALNPREREIVQLVRALPPGSIQALGQLLAPLAAANDEGRGLILRAPQD